MTTAEIEEPKPWHLSGNYAPVMDELTEHDLTVTGAIPSRPSSGSL